MALVGEVITRFKAETSDYMQKVEAARGKNRELAKSLLEASGSAETAIATLQTAKKYNGLGEFGIDPRQVSGLTREIRALDRELKVASVDANQLQQNLIKASAQRAGGFGDVTNSFRSFSQGDILQGLEQYKKGMADIKELGSGGGAFKGAVAATAIQLIGNELAKTTNKAKDLVTQWREGNITLGEMTDKLAGQLPIYGGIWQTGRNIREMITGEEAEARKMLETANKIKNAIDGWRKSLEDYKKSRENFDSDTQALNVQNQIANLRATGKDDEADQIELTQKYNEALKQATEEADRIYEARKKSIQETIKAERESGRTNFGGEERELERIAKERDEAIEARKAAIAEETRIELEQRQKARDEVAKREKEAADEKAKREADAIKAEQERQAEAARKEAEQAKKEAEDKAKAEAERIKAEKEAQKKAFDDRAKQLKDSLKTDTELFVERIKEAQEHLKGKDLEAFLNNEARKLKDELKTVEPHKVYSSPQVSELRAGQVLFNAPTEIPKQQLDAQRETNEKLQILIDADKQDDGIVIEQLGV